MQPVRAVCVLLSKYLNGEFDHCGVVVRDRSCDVSYLLEVGCMGRVQLRACDSRLLHSHSREVILRKLDCTRTVQQLDSVDQLVAQLAPPAATNTASDGQQPFSAFARPITPSILLPIERLLRLTVACVVVGAGGGEVSRSLHQLGQFVQTRQERQRTAHRLAALTEGLASDALDADSRTRLVGKQQRLTGALQKLERRESELRRQVEKTSTAAAGWKGDRTATAALPDVVAAPCADAALVAVVLHRLAVLLAVTWPAGSECAVPPPAVNRYQSKHFLSSITLPLAADAVLERELFIKSAGKPLPYTVTC